MIFSAESQREESIVFPVKSAIRMGIAKIKATIRLASTPEKATRNSSDLCPKFLGLVGTGLPQPNPTKNKKRVPMGSRWERGFRVRRPSAIAVGSPARYADQA